MRNSTTWLQPIQKKLELPTEWLHAWGQIKQELLYLIWAIMDVCLLVPVILMLMPWARFWPVSQITIWVLLFMLIPFNLIRLMSTLQLGKSKQQNIMVLALLMAILLAWRMLLYAPRPFFNVSWLAELFSHMANGESQLWARDITIFFVTLAAWWRGIRLVTLKPDVHRVGLRLRSSALIFALLGIILAQMRVDWQLLPFILLFYLVGLTAVALIRAEELEAKRSGLSANLTPRWLITIFTASLIVTTLAGLLTSLIAGESVFIIATWLSPLWLSARASLIVISNTFLYLISPLTRLLAATINFLAALISNIIRNMLAKVDENPLPTRPPFEFDAGTPLPEELVEIAGPPLIDTRAITILLMVAALLIVVLTLTRLYREAALAARDGTHITPVGSGRGDSLGLGQRIMQRLGLLRNWRAAASVRRIYQNMCHAAAGAGYPRAEAETPSEYLATIAEVWPENLQDSQFITEAFNKVRYGEIPETEEELNAIQNAWKRLEQAEPIGLEESD